MTGSVADPGGDRRPKLLLLLFTNLATEPRALRQIRAFSDRYRITTVGRGGLRDGVAEHIELEDAARTPVLWRKALFATWLVASKLRWYRIAYWANPLHRNLRRQLRRQTWDAIIAHDVMTLPLASAIPAQRGFVADMHEYAPRQYDNRPDWMREVAPLNDWLCRTYLPSAALCITVGPGLVKAYRDNYGVDARLVLSATDFADFVPRPTGSPIRCVHSGSGHPGRRAEIMIDAVMATSAPVTLDLYLVASDPDYIEELKKRAAGDARVTFHEPVPYEELVPTLREYDLGLCIIAPTTFNHLWSVPNKFFDYVQARLGLVVGPSPDMVSLVDEHSLGAALGTFEPTELAEFFEQLSPTQVDVWKAAAHDAAERLSGQREMDSLAKMLDELPHRV